MLLKKMWAHFRQAGELDDIMESFHQAGSISIESIGNQIIYVMPDTQAIELNDYFQGKGK
jgi:hypothetical protein